MEFRLLGPLEVRDGEQVIPVTSSRQRVMLAALALRAGSVVPVDDLVAIIWGESPPPSARSVLQSLALRLRKLLGPHVLVTRSPGYLLDVDPDTVDTAAARRLRAEAERAAAAGDLDTEADRLRSTLALWRGRALVDVDSDLLRREDAAWWAEWHLDTLERRIVVDLALGRGGQAIGELRELTAAHPFREQFRVLLVTALHQTGRRAEALAEYQAARTILIDELGVEPGANLRRAHREALGTEPEPPTERPAPAAPPAPVPAQLPHEASGFTGRVAELAALDELAAGRTPGVVIVAVTGPAGVGKTAFVVHWAHRNRTAFADGQLYADLRGFDARHPPVPPAEILRQFLRALGVPPAGMPDSADELTQLYRSTVAGRRLLVVLDNAATPDQVRPLLPGGDGCVVVVTSRRRLGGLTARDGARTVALNMLSTAESQELLAAVAGRDRLLADPDAATELAALCGHLPLALRIVAANLAATRLGIREVATELGRGDRLAALSFADDPETAVGAAFALSYAALEPTEQAMFRRLSLCTGPDTTVDIAAALVDGDHADPATLLGALASAHLVEEYRPRRYRLHDLLRLYATDRATAEDPPGTLAATRHRLLSTYLSTTDAACTLLFPHALRVAMPALASPPVAFADRQAALDWLDREHVNVLFAVADAVGGGEARLGWCLTDALRGYFLYNNGGTLWLDTLTLIADAAREHAETGVEGLITQAMGTYHDQRGAAADATAHYLRAVELHRRAGNTRAEANTLNNLSATDFAAGRLGEAIERLQRVITLFGQLHNQHGETLARHNLGRILLAVGRFHEAVGHATAALELTRQRESRSEEGLALHLLGLVHDRLGHTDEALAALHAAADIHQELGTRIELASVHAELALTYLGSGHQTEAARHAELGVRLARENGGTSREPSTLHARAMVHYEAGDTAAARRDLETAQTLTAGIQRPVETDIATALALVVLREGDATGALGHAYRALTLSRQSGSTAQEGDALIAAAAAHLALGEARQAATTARRAAVIHHDSGYLRGERRARQALARATAQGWTTA
ncbi:BTAD domain-containing putative transcriptional regulator [Longispora sp. K20-0274]|uniref:AfsR/SARP family transcriptional regulator n=1 Tax=Longispora sp. K20-0274 TaxID=3088255 RepID=UPI003999C766